MTSEFRQLWRDILLRPFFLKVYFQILLHCMSVSFIRKKLFDLINPSSTPYVVILIILSSAILVEGSYFFLCFLISATCERLTSDSSPIPISLMRKNQKKNKRACSHISVSGAMIYLFLHWTAFRSQLSMKYSTRGACRPLQIYANEFLKKGKWMLKNVSCRISFTFHTLFLKCLDLI